MSGKLAIALVEKSLGNLPMGMFTDVEQVRFDRNDLAASTAAITAGLRNIGLDSVIPARQTTTPRRRCST